MWAGVGRRGSGASFLATIYGFVKSRRSAHPEIKMCVERARDNIDGFEGMAINGNSGELFLSILSL